MNRTIVMGIIVAVGAIVGCKNQSFQPAPSAVAGAAPSKGGGSISASHVHGSIVNTTDNTWKSGKSWTANMGPLKPGFGGIACDNVDANRFRSGEAAVWFVAPSDSLMANLLGDSNVYCQSPGFGEPRCQKLESYCGRKIKVTCDEQGSSDSYGQSWCAKPGVDNNIYGDYSKLNAGSNYIPEIYRSLTASSVGGNSAAAKGARYVVVMITDFCPKYHTLNQKTGQCQGPQIDLSTPAFLMMGKVNNGYIDSSNFIHYNLEFLPEGSSEALGPHF